MTKTVDAIYEKGILRLMEPISLAEGSHVEVIVIARERSPEDRSPSEILAAIADMPLENGGRIFSGREHNHILYGEKE